MFFVSRTFSVFLNPFRADSNSGSCTSLQIPLRMKSLRRRMASMSYFVSPSASWAWLCTQRSVFGLFSKAYFMAFASTAALLSLSLKHADVLTLIASYMLLQSVITWAGAHSFKLAVLWAVLPIWVCPVPSSRQLTCMNSSFSKHSPPACTSELKDERDTRGSFLLAHAMGLNRARAPSSASGVVAHIR